jgi:hypothetical protein
MNKLIRWKIDHPEQPLIYESEPYRLELDQQEVKFHIGYMHANIIILPDELDLHTPTASDNIPSPNQESTPIRKRTRKTKTEQKAI